MIKASLSAAYNAARPQYSRHCTDRPPRPRPPSWPLRADRGNRRRQVDPARCAGSGARQAGGKRAGASRSPAGSGIGGGGGAVVLRRRVGADGRSRAFVNDEPASVGLLRDLGDSLVEIQGQFEQRGLLDPANHRMILAAFAEHSVAPHVLAKAWHDWREARQREADAARLLAASRDEEDLLRHHLAELDSLMPEKDEEDRLAARRTLLQNAERLAGALPGAI